MNLLVLPENCDRAAAVTLLPELVAASGPNPVEIDGTQVQRIGQSMLQVLLAVRRSAGGAIILASDPLRDAARLAGLEDTLLDMEAA